MSPAEKRTWKIIGIVALIAAAIFGMAQCGESSWYTFNGEKINRWIFIPLFAILIIAAFIWYKVSNKKKK